ncbi:unnamed protein product [Polarella glacialis]|uniref:Ion transport domain-containing protein n=1 Tax=Polarella glacialis TaxID=89957 RepID=A0A813GGC2_POLGL|nr:unnamed protein product [Polarella glacialis]
MAEGVGDTPMEAASPSRASLALGFVSELGKEISAAFAAVWTRSLSAGAEHGFTLLSEQPSEQSGQLEAGRGTAPSCQRPEEQSSADEGNSGNSNNNNHRKLWHTQPEFQGAVFVAILLNTLLVTVKASFIQASSVRYFSGIAENTFTVFFALELILRIFEHGSFASYFCGKAAGWNLFDFLVTGVGIAEGLLQLLTKEADTHLKMVQVIRLFRVLRMLRLLRAIRFLSEVDYVVRLAFRTMFYYGLLLLLAQFMFAIWATNLLWDFPDQQIAGMFSSLGDSMWTLFCLMTLDGWIAIVNVILEQEPYMLVFFTFFIFFSVSAVSIVPAIFIEVHSQAREARLIKEAQQASGARQGSKRTSSKPRPRIARHSEEAELRGSSAAQGNNSNNNNSSAAATTYENPGTRHLPRSPASVPTFIRVLSWNTSESESQSPLRRGRMLNDYSDGSKEGEDQQDEEEQSEEILPDWQEAWSSQYNKPLTNKQDGTNSCCLLWFSLFCLLFPSCLVLFGRTLVVVVAAVVVVVVADVGRWQRS